MGIVSTIGNALSSAFSKKSSPSSSSQPTTTTTTQPAQNVGGVIVTDLKSGESVKTNVNSQGNVTQQTYSASPSGSSTLSGSSGGRSSSSSTGSSSPIGEAASLDIANREGGLVSSTIKEKTAEAQQTKAAQGGNTIKPATNSVSAASQTGDVPQRYERSVSSGFLQVAKNLNPFSSQNTYGLLTSGIGSFSRFKQQTFIEPFSQTSNGLNKVQAIVPLYPKGGTSFSGQRVTTPYTGAQIVQQERSIPYQAAGIPYKGEPDYIFPTRLREKIGNDLQGQYQAKADVDIANIQQRYQQRLDTGEITLQQANVEYKAAVDQYVAQSNTFLNQAVQSRYNSEIGKYIPMINQIESYRAKVSEPYIIKDFRIGSFIAENIALGAAATIGTSGVTLAAAAYQTARTTQTASQYFTNYSSLNVGQKIAGAAGIAAGAYYGGALFELGVSRFYTEWRSAIYEGLANTPARITGQELARDSQVSTYAIQADRYYNVNQARTISKVDVYPTGTDRVGIFGKGFTYTRILDPETGKFIYSREAFSLAGNVKNIKELPLIFQQGGLSIQQEGLSAATGEGSARYMAAGKDGYVNFKFTPVSRDIGQSYSVLTARPSSTTQLDEATDIGAITGNRLDAYGSIAKMTDQSSTFNIGISRNSNIYSTSDVQSALRMQSVESGSAATVSKKAQDITLSSLSKQTVSGNSAALTQSLRVVSSPSFAAPSYSVEQSLPAFAVSSTAAQSLVQRQGFSPALTTPNALSTPTQGNTPTVTTLPVIATPVIELAQPASSTSTATSTTFVPPATFTIPTIGGGFFIPPVQGKKGLGDDVYGNVLKGGKRTTQYVPSFSALVFKIRGKYRAGTLSKSGLDFRPITSGFSFGKSGANFLRRFARRR